MKQYIRLCILRWTALSSMFLTATPCQRPDVPVGGSFVPVSKKYGFGDKVVYTCKKDFLLMGKETRMCGAEDKWLDKTPFCDIPTKIKNPSASSSPYMSMSPNKAVDGNTTTCYASKKGTEQSFKVFLDKPAVINYVRLYLPRGSVNIRISIMQGKVKKNCTGYCRDLEEPQWALLQCEDNQTAESIQIQDISSSQNILGICEVEIYVKEGAWCADPPGIYISNGWLEVSREKTTLQCAEGYQRSENVRLICNENQKWIGKILQCDEIKSDKKESRIKSTTLIIVSTIVVLLIFACFGLVLFLVLKKRSKPVVVVLKADSTGYTVQSCSDGTVAYNESEYSSIPYETVPFKNPSPRPPISPPPAHLLDNYSKPADQWSLVDYSKMEKAPPYQSPFEESQESFLTVSDSNTQPDSAFQSMKSSTLYGT